MQPTKKSRKISPKTRRTLIAALIGAIAIVLAAIITGVFVSKPNLSIMPDNPTPTISLHTTPIAENLSFSAVSSPNYANVAVTLLSVVLPLNSDQHMQLNFSFKNNGKNTCQNIKFHTITLTDSTGIRYHVIDVKTNQHWTLTPGQTIEQSRSFQEAPMQGLRYALQFSLELGGCITPPDTSKNKFASYQSESFLLS